MNDVYSKVLQKQYGKPRVPKTRIRLEKAFEPKTVVFTGKTIPLFTMPVHRSKTGGLRVQDLRQ